MKTNRGGIGKKNLPHCGDQSETFVNVFLFKHINREHLPKRGMHDIITCRVASRSKKAHPVCLAMEQLAKQRFAAFPETELNDTHITREIFNETRIRQHN
jgi:hypothetical protein